ncbi:MAG: imelysin family protein [Solirubrobacterales bacterium]
MQITCGLLTNPRGKMHVTAPGHCRAAPRSRTSRPSSAPLAEYKVYLAAARRARFAEAANAFANAMKSGDLQAAKAPICQAQAAYGNIAPVMPLLSPISTTAINARADVSTQREADPAFVGLHRLEYGLFAKGSLDDLAPVADRLAADASALKARVHDLRITPETMAGGAAAILQRVAGGRSRLR